MCGVSGILLVGRLLSSMCGRTNIELRGKNNSLCALVDFIKLRLQDYILAPLFQFKQTFHCFYWQLHVHTCTYFKGVLQGLPLNDGFTG